VTSSGTSALQAVLEDWRSSQKMARLWSRDASVWTGGDESKWLGWLDIVEAQLNDGGRFAKFSHEVRDRDFTDILLLGMGGSSLCPEVLELSFGKAKGFPKFHVLDSTDPAQLAAVESSIDLQRTLFIVSSKSGSTLEPNIFKQYFFERSGRDGTRFVAVPSSSPFSCSVSLLVISPLIFIVSPISVPYM
jgi:transaldolase/glucose-6-phosphate isomerase